MAAQTVLDRLIEHLRARGTALDGLERPVAVLWTDPKGEWGALLNVLRERVEEFVVLGGLGDYDPARRVGPAVWLRCLVDRTLDEPKLPEGRTLILYLPGVGRQDLRAGEECPDRLKPLVELLYRGALWHHPNGGDWTVHAFLTSPGGLGLDVAGDRRTAEALGRALGEVALTPVAQLAGRRLEADDFDRMLAGDVNRDVLRWMGDPDAERRRRGENGWRAFCNRCREELDFDPAAEADVAAGERMARGEGAWAAVWERFAEAPDRFGAIEGLLRRSAPAGALRFGRERWPDLNEEDEEAVRRGLRGLPRLSHDAACDAVIDLERKHGERRAWVWARLGQTPMAEVLEPLARLAAGVRQAVGGAEPADVAAAYRERGWQADLGAWQAVAAAPAADEADVAAAVRHLLLPWLDDSARAFQAAVDRAPLPDASGQAAVERAPLPGADGQAAVERAPLPGADGQPAVAAAEDGCLVFVDGLRFDLAQRLVERLEGRGLRVDAGWRWAALPTVTGTGKPAVTPVAGEIARGAREPVGGDAAGAARASGAIGGGAAGSPFDARMRDGGKRADAATLRAALEAAGYQMLGPAGSDAAAGSAGPAGRDATAGAAAPGAPRTHPARGWLETGAFDRLGHDRGARLARELDPEIDRLAERIFGLLDAGWTSVRVVTDHGWLWLPGGLPKVDLPQHLTESRWARCAALAGESTAGDVLRVRWHWDGAQWFATPPGAACFKRGEEYAHGGLSIQECLIPDVTVTRPAGAEASARITSVTWRGLRCFLEAEVRGGPVTADLRLERPSGPSVAAAAKPVEAEGSVSLVLADDEHEAAALVLVLFDEAGRVLAQRPVRVGVDA